MSYKRIAFFVEGYTEQEFVKKLLLAIFDVKKIAIGLSKIKGGNKIPICHTVIKSAVTTDDTIYYVLIYDCGGDANVKSYVLDHRQSLLSAGYVKVIGLRDIYPQFVRGDIFKLKQFANYGVPQKDLPIKFVIAIMEIESWFLAEENHFLKIDAVLDESFLKTNFNLVPSKDDTELVDEPANFLDAIYKSVGSSYIKQKASIDRTTDAVDYTNLYFNVRQRNSSLNELINEFEEVLF
jgi:hypothetical protein